MATSNFDGSLTFFDAEAARPGRELAASEQAATSLVFSPRGKEVAAGFGGGEIAIFDVQSDQPRVRFSGTTASSFAWLTPPRGTFWPLPAPTKKSSCGTLSRDAC